MFSSETVHIARTCFFSLSLRGVLFLIVCRATAVARLTYDASGWRGFTNASDRQGINSVIDLGLPDIPYFTGDPVFQTLSPASRGGKPPGRTNLTYSLSQTVASLRRHCDT